jgi:RNA polymerase sigma factor (sigma-70 family)
MDIGSVSLPGPADNGPGEIDERRQLVSLAYRLLGSMTDAEDVAQEAYARWYAMSSEERSVIDSPGGWLTTVASRICLNLLASARMRRESYIGDWIPEPLPDLAEWSNGPSTSSAIDPADRVTLDESVTMAFLVVLETMTPAERVAFVLHDVFRYSFAEVAEVVGRTPAACRQLASAARRRVRDSHQSQPRPTDQARIVGSFKQAWEAQDIAGLVALLDPVSTFTADGGGIVNAIRRPIRGAEQVALGCVNLLLRNPGLTIVQCAVNGQPGLVTQVGGVTVAVLAFDILDDRIKQIWSVVNPTKLRPWATRYPTNNKE